MLNFTCHDGDLFTKEAQTLVQHNLQKHAQKTFGLLQSEKYLPNFWTLVKDFVDT